MAVGLSFRGSVLVPSPWAEIAPAGDVHDLAAGAAVLGQVDQGGSEGGPGQAAADPLGYDEPSVAAGRSEHCDLHLVTSMAPYH